MSEFVCYDEPSENGGIWLDELGRSCIYYEKFNETCKNDVHHPCCICRGKKSLSINAAAYVTEYDPVWAIVVVAFCLLLICILSVSFYFICHLYRNEKRKTFRLQKANTQRHIASHTVTSKSDLSKTDLEIEDEYAPIPGDIGVGKKEKKKENKESQNDNDNEKDITQNDNENDDEDGGGDDDDNDENCNDQFPNGNDEYAVIDDEFGKYSKRKTKTVALKSNTQRAYHQSTRRRYSAELEFNDTRTLKSKKRQRHSSKFNLKHAYHHTQDDMIFLSYEQYLENDEEEETHKHELTSKERFSRMSTRRVVKLFAPQEIKYNDIDFSDQMFIGKGSFGAVVKAKYHEIDVAVKKLHTQRLSGSELLNFKREAAIMQKVGGHKHIARMYGFCTKPEICIVTEYYARGSLHDIIKNKKNKINKKRITTELKIQMALEASLGIWHLHRQQVIHRDISARNLLVDENWTVVVADLGMSRFKGNEISKGKNIGPVKWMAPESIIGNEYSEKSDSYSFGITLYEIFSESEPYPGLLPLEAGAKVVHEGIRPCIDKNKKIINVPNLTKLLTMLWKPQPKDRPDFLFITQSLKKIKKQWMIKKSKYKYN